MKANHDMIDFTVIDSTNTAPTQRPRAEAAKGVSRGGWALTKLMFKGLYVAMNVMTFFMVGFIFTAILVIFANVGGIPALPGLTQ